MLCNVYGWKDTGLNAYNTLSDTAILKNNSTNLVNLTPYGSVDIRQQRVLSSIRVNVDWNTVRDVDIVEIVPVSGGYAAWYAVDGSPVMLAEDVAQINLVFDAWLSALEIGHFFVADGITRRITVDDSPVSPGASFTMDTVEPDEYLAPAKPLKLDAEYIRVTDPTNADREYFLIESTIDLSAVFDNAISYIDTVSGTRVTAPTLKRCPVFTQYSLQNIDGTQITSLSNNPMTALYCVTTSNKDTVLDVINQARSLGMESAIISIFRIPKDLVVAVAPSSVTGIIGKTVDYDATTLKFNPYTRVNNPRLLCSEYTPFGLVSFAGDRATYDIKDIYNGSDTDLFVRIMSDPHSDGKPYFRPRYLFGGTTGFFMNCIAGMQWKQVPLTYFEKSGNLLNTVKFNASTNADLEAYNASMRSLNAGYIRDTMQRTGNVLSGVFGAENKFQALGSAIGGVGSQIAGTYFAETERENLQRMYVARRRSEVANYVVDNMIAAPEVAMPYNSETARDFTGAIGVAYRYHYDAEDQARIDKILSMYGYRKTKALDINDFRVKTGRYYQYVEATGASFSSDRIPMWHLDALSAQVSGGLRIWGSLPTAAHLATNRTS